MQKITIIFLTLLSVLCSTPALAKDLSPAVIDRWIATLTAFENQEADLPNSGALDMNDGELGGDILAMQQQLQARLAEEVERYPEAMAILRQNGFSSGEAWAATYLQIGRAFGALQMEEQGGIGELDQEMRQALAQLDSNPHLSEAQKAQIRQQMGAATQTLETFTHGVSAADKAAVRARLKPLQTLFDTE